MSDINSIEPDLISGVPTLFYNVTPHVLSSPTRYNFSINVLSLPQHSGILAQCTVKSSVKHIRVIRKGMCPAHLIVMCKVQGRTHTT